MSNSPKQWYYYDENENTIGPLRTEELLSRLESGDLSYDQRIWDDRAEEWKFPEDVPGIEEPSEDSLRLDGDEDELETSEDDENAGSVTLLESLNCVNHPEKHSVGHCIHCEDLLCEQCIRFKQNGSYCADCTPEDLSTLPEAVPDEFFNRWLYYARQYPSVGISLLFLGFISLSLIFGPVLKRALSGEYRVSTSRMYYQQLNRTLYRAQKLSIEDRDSEQWFRLANQAGDRLMNARSTPRQLKRQAVFHLLRINYELRDWEKFEQYLQKAKDQLRVPNQNPNYVFFRGLYLTNVEEKHYEAIEKFRSLRRIFSTRNPAAEKPRVLSNLKYPLLNRIKFNRHELLYHLGRTLEAIGKEDKASRIFLKVSVDDISSWWKKRTEREMLK